MEGYVVFHLVSFVHHCHDMVLEKTDDNACQGLLVEFVCPCAAESKEAMLAAVNPYFRKIALLMM